MMFNPRGRLVLIGSIVIDVLLYVNRLPERGSDALASASRVSPGGGFNILSSARKLGMEAAYGGIVGSGPNGAAIAGALEEHGIEHLLPLEGDREGDREGHGDNGFVVGAIEPSGERTFITAPGCESMMESDHLLAIQELLRPDDVIYVSGYELLYPVSGPAIASWIAGVAGTWPVTVDPGPLVGTLPEETFFDVLRACSMLTLNEREARILYGLSLPESHVELEAPATAAVRISVLETVAETLRHKHLSRDAAVIVRAGELGCVICDQSSGSMHLPTRVADMVLDTTGAGDVHTAAFLAAYYGGMPVAAAAWVANVAASISVSRRGGASSPTAGELDGVLRSMGGPPCD
ncbi:MAG: PfkB family carbohydrate kinase [Acidimicrobiales bacterium]